MRLCLIPYLLCFLVTDEMGNLDVDEKEGKKRQTRGMKR